jgi:hypothetical protein
MEKANETGEQTSRTRFFGVGEQQFLRRQVFVPSSRVDYCRLARDTSSGLSPSARRILKVLGIKAFCEDWLRLGNCCGGNAAVLMVGGRN